MIVKGYKAFNKDKTNRYGKPFVEGEKYHTDGPISFGNDGNGFHMCVNLCDVFRYFDTENDNFVVAEVIGSGNCVYAEDEYNGYYDMYACEDIEIVSFMSRTAIIDEMLKANSFSVIKFIKTFKMTEEEKLFFSYKFIADNSVICAMIYYQYGDTTIYERQREENNAGEHILRLVNNDGQNNC